MIGPLRKLFRPRGPSSPVPAQAAIPAGQRVYAIGDIHGRLDLMEAIIAAIAQDDAARNAATGPAHTTIILLGDLVDRGPDSAGVLARARDWQREQVARGGALHILMGNHEEMMLDSLERLETLRHFTTYGGKETILSFGVDEDTYNQATWQEVQAMLRAALIPEWLGFVSGFEPMVRIGDYAFAHAGVKPERPLEEQHPSDLRWIREPFLSSTLDHGAMIVHGHTISEEPVLRANRIGIDTGAYMSGRLTALALEGTARAVIVAQAQDGVIVTSSSAA